MKLIRVFPRKTNATPDDDMVYFGEPPLFRPEADEIHVSCTFTYDRDKAMKLADSWTRFYPTKIGGPAFVNKGDEFVPGCYLKEGYIITSRGCDQQCWFCYVPTREGKIRELEIKDGWNVLDNNLLACSDDHIHKVFNMLENQKHKIVLSGGLDSKKMHQWIARRLAGLDLQRAYFAYDTADDKEPLIEAQKMLLKAKDNWWHAISCYVLIGYPKDTFEKATSRLEFVFSLGITPFAMLYRDDEGKVKKEWRQFQRLWVIPKVIWNRKKEG